MTLPSNIALANQAAQVQVLLGSLAQISGTTVICGGMGNTPAITVGQLSGLGLLLSNLVNALAAAGG